MASSKPRLLVAIATFKLSLAFLIFLAAVGVIQLLREKTDYLLYRLVDNIGFDLESRLLDGLVNRLISMSHLKVKLLSAAALVYSVLFFIEGFGLYNDFKWAELFTIIVTAGFVPIEVYETIVKTNWVKIVIIMINIGIVAYLVVRLRQKGSVGKGVDGEIS